MPDSTRRQVPKDRAPEDKVAGRRERRLAPGESSGYLVFTPAVAADEVAEMALRVRAEVDAKNAPIVCDLCATPIEGEPAGSGLYVWSRGEDDARFEEPPLCEGCATAIGVSALRVWGVEEEEG